MYLELHDFLYGLSNTPEVLIYGFYDSFQNTS